MNSSPSAVTEAALGMPGPPPGALPRLLAGIPSQGAMELEEHVGRHGPLPDLARSRRGHAREQAGAMIDELERSGLLGRGGAAFPTATKMRAVAGARGRAIVVVNGVEREPASLKDRTLMEMLPHLVLDGAILAARAVDGDEVIVCVCETARASVQSMALAIGQRERSPASLGDGRPPRLRLATVPAHFVAGEESALVRHLDGGPAKPTFTPPRPFERGVSRRPTLINNTETLAHVALIARHGAPWFRQLGTAGQPGSALLTLSGPVANPGVYEIEHGASLTSLIAAAGGARARVRAALIGGYAGSWIGAERLQGVALSNEHLAPHGASLGAGVVLLLSEEACPVAETARVSRWLAEESAAQCGPCVHGLHSLAATIDDIAQGAAPRRATLRVERLASLVSGRGACGHPDGAVNFILSALECFEAEFAEHARHGRCEACMRPAELPLPPRVHAAPSRKAAR
ncbi:MAG TPA: NADH-ubiquinone oxidoreductase-F iron-sulfur binding region domain-containing protein [Solirubrobacteraceae bacterium]|jgi:NADH:ubiquinone oxidoreductase subunit F (NADH-binding)|nr:NADH-ubiquinone oxidoreductase-F iron-sulfur binding region domain-containing protein [Solirubrobacteraceae bacterium]